MTRPELPARRGGWRAWTLLVAAAPALLASVAEADTKRPARGGDRASFEAILRKPMIARPSSAGEADRWMEILSARRPSSIVALCDAFRFDFPDSRLAEEAWKMSFNAYRAMRVKSDVGLSEEFFDTTRGSAELEADLLGAARGDHDAAFRVAGAFASGRSGVPADSYRHEQWLRFAADLGHGQAAWDLAQRYNHQGLVAEAAHYEARARQNGYKPAPRLSNRDY